MTIDSEKSPQELLDAEFWDYSVYLRACTKVLTKGALDRARANFYEQSEGDRKALLATAKAEAAKFEQSKQPEPVKRTYRKRRASISVAWASRATNTPGTEGRLIDSAAAQPKRQNQALALVTARNVTVELAAQLTGLTVHGIRGKMKRGQWAGGIHYFKAPDGRIYINLAAVERWIEKGV